MTLNVLSVCMSKSLSLALIFFICTSGVHLEGESSQSGVSEVASEKLNSTDLSLNKSSSIHPILESIQKLNKDASNVSSMSKSEKEAIAHNVLREHAKSFGLGNLNLTHLEHEGGLTTEGKPATSESETTLPSATEENGKSSEETSTKPSIHTGIEKAPEDTFAVWDDDGKICILAKFDAVFAIAAATQITIDLPKDATAKGKCQDDVNFIKISGAKFHFIMEFSKINTDEMDEWYVSGLELQHRQKDKLKDAIPRGRNSTFEAKNLELFKTPFGRSYLCPSAEVIHLRGMHSSSDVNATMEMKEIQLQPFDVKEGKFSRVHKCNQVVSVGPEEPITQSETVPLAVGLTLAILTLIAVLGFSIHRAYTMRKVDYNSME